MKLLVIGDVVGEAGIDALHGLLRRIIEGGDVPNLIFSAASSVTPAQISSS